MDNRIENSLRQALERIIAISPATLTYTSASVEVSARVKKSFTDYSVKNMKASHYEDGLDDMFVIAKTEDVQGWGLSELISEVKVDNQVMKIGRTINKTPVSWKIYLRSKP